MIKVNNLSKKFGKFKHTTILDNVSFELPDKGLVAIFGKSGSGKTTLLNIIGGLDKASSGEVFINDTLINSFNRDKVRNKQIGYIFQNYYLESGYTVEEILTNSMHIAGFKDLEEIKRRINVVLDLVDLKKYENKSADALSGGQKQRVAIARTLIKGANIILADEPTGNLDVENTIHIMNILKKISKTRLVVLVTHETSLITQYADSHIKLVDGKLIENTIVLDQNHYEYQESNIKEVEIFDESESKTQGKLFNFKNIVKKIKNTTLEKGIIFKKIFITCLSLITLCLSFLIYENIRNTPVHKKIDDMSIYTKLNTYSELSMIDRSYYDSIDFFDINMKSGQFSYSNIQSVSSINLDYSPVAIESDSDFETVYGKTPELGEVMISTKLCEEIKHNLRISELETNEAILLMNFDNDYKISGIVECDEPYVYFNKLDYVNFLGIYSDLKIVDNKEIFLSSSYKEMTYSATIKLADESKGLKNDQVIVDISRNSLYKMMSDSSEADYKCEMANKKLVKETTAIYIENSLMYVKSFNITREAMDTDIAIYVNKETLKNLFIYLTPNIEILGNDTSTSYYFCISTSTLEQYNNLSERLKTRGVQGVDINSIYESSDKKVHDEQLKNIYICLIGALLLLCIYYFIEMSESLKNSRDYGVYRAIGVNKSNLLFKEVIRVIYKNISIYLITSLIGTIIVSSYYSVLNQNFINFIQIELGLFALGTVILILVSLINYLFVLTKTPSEIISRYDI